ncbi:probable ribonuclease ZC3H12B [Paramacrobiotus metropolitanus]|uniref:probable ribonuclease ZC3H12B n=1 Tax=Paramacrobiotus metropolitanus TaxID=2943436 RepID=UPI002445D488|nr:probable ribonuclease ZC3H12B [Paramacrobiotus metropolitanus]
MAAEAAVLDDRITSPNLPDLTGLEECSSKPGLEKTDSCYDSDDHDDDNAEGNVTRNVRNLEHRDVSRTVSETLKEEYDPAPETYTTYLSFALKLGYTESQVQKALEKLGTQVTQNEFLAELIKLGAGESAVDEDDEEDDGDCADTGSTSSPSHTRSPADLLLTSAQADTREFTGLGNQLGSSVAAVGPAVSQLRHIVIDGSNVAMSHGNKVMFSCRGIALCVDYFKQRGHKDITVFVPQWRKETSKPDAPIRDQELLLQLEREGILTFTPSRYVGKRRLVCYDDRYVLKLAMETDGIIVSNDTYRDLIQENADFRKVVEERLLMYSFVNDRFMPPDDPLGRHGPTLSQFLRKSSKRQHECISKPCPYGKKCTYGNKCKFAHPERGNQPQKSVTEIIGEKAKIQLQEIKERELKFGGPEQKLKLTATLSSPVPRSPTHKPVVRTRSMVPGDTGNFPAEQTAFPFSALTGSQPTSPRFLRVPSPAPAYRPASVDNVERLAGNVDRMFLKDNRPNNNHSPRHCMPLVQCSPRGMTCQANGFGGFAATPPQLRDLGIERKHPALVQTLSDGPYGQPRQENMHNKLQRQLSLNPYAEHQQQMLLRDSHRNLVNPIAQQSTGLPAMISDKRNPMVYRPTSASDCAGFNGSGYQFAPGTTLPADSFFAHTSTQSSFYLRPQHTVSAAPSTAQPPSTFTDSGHRSFGLETNLNAFLNPAASRSAALNLDAQRSDIFNRLTTLFPEEQVTTVMMYYPREYNLHKLCSAILAMFPDGRQG